MPSWKRCLFFITLICCLSTLSWSVTAAPIKVLTSVYPVYLFAKNVVGDVPGVQLELLLPPQKGCPHDYSLTPGDMKKLGQADVFLINGAGLEEYLDRIKEIYPRLRLGDTSTGISLIREGEASFNPHTFVSPANAILQARNIAAVLSEIDPANSAAYQQNAAVFSAQLSDLLAEFQAWTQKSPRKIITFHDAFAYLARDTGLEVVGVIESAPGQEPAAGELVGLVKLIRREKIKAVFAEPQYSPKIAEVLVKETGATLLYLDPVASGTSLEASTYISVMRQNLQVLQQVLGD